MFVVSYNKIWSVWIKLIVAENISYISALDFETNLLVLLEARKHLRLIH